MICEEARQAIRDEWMSAWLDNSDRGLFLDAGRVGRQRSLDHQHIAIRTGPRRRLLVVFDVVTELAFPLPQHLRILQHTIGTMPKIILFVMAALFPAFALAAETQPPLPPQVEACQQTILKLTGEQLQWQTQAISLQRHIDDLNKQIASTEAKPESPKP